MNRRTTFTLTVALMVALAAMPLGAAGALANDHEQTDESESVAPGEQLTGVIGVQEAEVQGELSDRTYGIKLASAQSAEERADVVDEQLADVETRLTELEERLETLDTARENGEISEGQYRAEAATVAAEKGSVERTAEAARATAEDLPAEVLEDRGIDVEAIEELRTRADELGGQAVAEIARSIAGDAVGQSPAADREPGAPIETPDQDRTDDDTDRSDDPENGTSTDDDEAEDEASDSPTDGDEDEQLESRSDR